MLQYTSIAPNAGYPGSFARNGDCIIAARQVKTTGMNSATRSC